MTPEELSALRSMSDKEIRRAQAIVQAQLPLAHAKGLTQTLLLLQGWERDYADEMLRR